MKRGKLKPEIRQTASVALTYNHSLFASGRLPLSLVSGNPLHGIRGGKT
jgi:hypothetical protein